MTGGLILAIDQGTTNTKTLLVDAAGRVVARAARPLPVAYPQPGWVEQDAHGLWLSVVEAIDECLAGQTDNAVAAVAISNQRESTVAWERATGNPLGPCVVWQCRRSAALCNHLRTSGHAARVRRLTGLAIAPMFSAGKMRWLLDSIPDGAAGAADGEVCLGTVDSWLLWNLSGRRVFACDATNASRTQLMSIRRLAWDERLLCLYGIARASLPSIRPSSHIYGKTRRIGRLRAGTPIASAIGDSHAALFGHAGFHPGCVKATYGTGSSLMTPMSGPILSRRGLSTTVAWLRSTPTYALEGNILATGAAVQWLSDVLGLGDPLGIERLAAQVHDTGGVYLVPAFTGLAAPYWQDGARALICGMTRATNAAHLARATLEAIAYQVRAVFDAMVEEAGVSPSALLADGGASRNDLLMQIQADVIGYPVLRSASPDVSALGAAYLAGLAVQMWADEAEISALVSRHDCFEPTMPAGERDALYDGWRSAVQRTVLQA